MAVKFKDRVQGSSKSSKGDVFVFIVGLIFDFLVLISGKLEFSGFVAGAVLVLDIIVILIIWMIAQYFHRYLIQNCYEHIVNRIVSKAENSQYETWVSNLMQSDFYKKVLNTFQLSPEKMKEYNLISANDFDEKEKQFFKNYKEGEIWVISNALETEIDIEDGTSEHVQDLSLRQSMGVVKNNIKNGGRYVQFVTLGVQGEDDGFCKRRDMYWQAKPELMDDISRKKEMPVIRIDSDFKEVGLKRNMYNEPDWAFMVKLTSTVIFIDENKHFREGFFCFRPEYKDGAEEYERRTIMFKMPSYCMLNDIIKDLKGFKEEYFRELGE